MFKIEGKGDGVQVIYKDETIWATQKVMAQLFDVGVPAINKHLNNIYLDGELIKESTVSKMEIVQIEGSRKIERLQKFYNLDASTTRKFFKMVQNKIHYAEHRHTAAELIVERADATKEHMGLSTWENAPEGKIVKTDVSIAKNYLRENEQQYMWRLVNAVLDIAERMAERHINTIELQILSSFLP